jgi:hypothetical protein
MQHKEHHTRTWVRLRTHHTTNDAQLTLSWALMFGASTQQAATSLVSRSSQWRVPPFCAARIHKQNGWYSTVIDMTHHTTHMGWGAPSAHTHCHGPSTIYG